MPYGLEVFELTAKDVHQFEKFQRSTLRLIQNFPINTAICAVHGLLGIRSMQQELDRRKLTLLGNVLSNRDSIEYGPAHEISNNVVCVTSKASDQPAQTRSLIRAFASRLSIL